MNKNKIKVIVCDVDGTLTDGTINIGPQGEVFKGFYCRDGLGIIHAIEAGIEVVILTSRHSEITTTRAAELGITTVFQGAKGKKEEILLNYINQQELEKTDIAYIGDDLNDYESMQLCGVVGCPADAVREIKEIADFVSNHNGGRGAVREFIDWLLNV